MLILRALAGRSPANYPASLAPTWAAALAEGLAAHHPRANGPRTNWACWPCSGICTCACLHSCGGSSPNCSLDRKETTTMSIKISHPKTKRSPSFTLNAPVTRAHKPQHLRGFRPLPLGQRCPSYCPPQPGPNGGQPGPVLRPSEPTLGRPMDIRAVAILIGCSPWTVRQRLIPFGLPHFRSGASSKLIFYRDQVVRWIESQQKGG
jgi:hypothetical protein